MPKDKSAKKKTKEKSPKKSEEENPAMDEADINRLLQNALEQLNAQHEEKLKELDKKLTKSFDKKLKAWEQQKHHEDEIREMQDTWEQTRGEKPSTKDTQIFRIWSLWMLTDLEWTSQSL